MVICLIMLVVLVWFEVCLDIEVLGCEVWLVVLVKFVLFLDVGIF